MKIALLHISDFHLKDKDTFNYQKIDSFINCLKSLPSIDEIIILISGDITFSGKINEYKVFKKLKGTLINKLKEELIGNKYIYIYCVPGNHDLDYTNLSRKFKDIENAYKEKKIDKILDDEFSALSNYHSNIDYRCSIDKNRLVAMHNVQYGDFSIQINLINSAPFSTLEHDDRELHYFQENDYSFLEKRNNVDFCLTMMHHPTDCFNWDAKFRLINFIANNNHILLVGHEHKDIIEEVSIEKQTGLYISRAGEMQWGKSDFSDFFNTIILDTQRKVFSIYSFKWDSENGIYKKKEHLIDKKISIKTNRLLPSPDFLKEFNLDKNILQKPLPYDKYFVFPTLVQEKTNEDEISAKINNFSEFSDFLSKFKRIWIEGQSFSGKSTLAKYLFNEFSIKKVPLILRVSKGKINLKNLIRTLFTEQYGFDEADWNKYEQLDKNEKILIIDDFDLINNKTTKEKLLMFIEEHFEEYVIISNDNNSYDIVADVREEVKDTYENDNVFGYLKINHFFGKKRRELVKNICVLNNVDKEVNISTINKLIDSLVHNNTSLFTLKPNFIIQYTKFFLQDGQYESKRGEAIFSKIFEHNINSALINHSSESELDETITAIEEIAYYMHFNKKDILKYDELEAIIKEYSNDYSVSINIKHFRDTLINSNIFKEDTDSFSIYFQNKNYLSYFVAKCLNRRFNNEGDYNDIENVLKNICFGINSDIVLFISYLSNNTRIINTICEYANNLMSDIEAVSFESDNIKLLSNNFNIKSIGAPKNEDKEEYEKRQDKIEEITYDVDNIEARGIYEYDETEINSFHNKLSCSIKYTEMICKALPAFYSIMKATSKTKLVDSIFSFPNKIIFSLLDPVSSSIENVCTEIKKYADEICERSNIKKILTEDKIAEMLSVQAQCIFLSVYNTFSELAVNKKSLDILLSYQDSTIAHKFFKLSILDNYGNTDAFFKAIESFLKEYDKPNLRLLTQRLVRKHLMCNNVPQAKKQRIIDKVWGKHARKQVLVTLPQNKEI